MSLLNFISYEYRVDLDSTWEKTFISCHGFPMAWEKPAETPQGQKFFDKLSFYTNLCVYFLFALILTLLLGRVFKLVPEMLLVISLFFCTGVSFPAIKQVLAAVGAGGYEVLFCNYKKDCPHRCAYIQEGQIKLQ